VLELFGARYVLSRTDWLPIDTAFGDRFARTRADREPCVLGTGARVAQDFRCTVDGLSSVAVLLAPGARAGGLEMRLSDAATNAPIAARFFAPTDLAVGELSAGDLAVLGEAPRPGLQGASACAILEFEPQADSKDKRYRLEFEAGASGDGATLVRLSRAFLAGAQLRIGDRIERGMIEFDYRGGEPEFERVARCGDLALHRHTRGLGRWFAVSDCVRASTHEDALEQVSRPEFDPYRGVVLEGGAGGESNGSEPASAATVIECGARRVRLKVERGEPGWLVACQTFFPGWKARVNGVEAPIERANVAFCAIAIPAGASAIELVYRPATFVLGAKIAFAALVAGLVLVWRSARAARRDQ
jgi:hypothetical protein